MANGAYSAYGADDPGESRAWAGRALQLVGCLLVLYAARNAWIEYSFESGVPRFFSWFHGASPDGGQQDVVTCNIAGWIDFPTLREQISWTQGSAEASALDDALYPIPGQTVHLYQLLDTGKKAVTTPYSASVESDERGDASFAGAPPGLYEVWSHYADAEQGLMFADSQHVWLESGTPPQTALLTMDKVAAADWRPASPAGNAIFLGRVVNKADKSPVTQFDLEYEYPGEEINYTQMDFVPRDRRVRHEKGEFLLPWLGDSLPTITISKPGFLISRMALTSAMLNPDRPYVLELDPGLQVAGRVLGQDGHPVSNTRIQRTTGTMRGGRSGIRVDEQGNFTLSAVEPGQPKQIYIQADGYVLRPVSFEASDYLHKPLEIILRPDGKINVVVLEDGAPVTFNAMIAAQGRTRRNIPNGEGLLEDLLVGPNELVIGIGEERELRLPVVVQSGEVTTARVEYSNKGTGRVRGMVSIYGAPSKRFMVRLSRMNGELEDIRTYRAMVPRDEAMREGEYFFEALEPGTYTLTLTSNSVPNGDSLPDHRNAFMQQRTIEVGEGQEVQEDFAMDTTGSIECTIVARDANERMRAFLIPGRYVSEPYTGTEEENERIQFSQEYLLQMEVLGGFKFPEVALGQYTLVVARRSLRDRLTSLFRYEHIPVEVEAHRTTHIQLDGSLATLATTHPAAQSPSL